MRKPSETATRPHPGNRLRPADAARTLSPGRTRSRSDAPEPPPHQPARATANEAARAAVRRRLFRYEHLMARHPELAGEIRDLSDADSIFR